MKRNRKRQRNIECAKVHTHIAPHRFFFLPVMKCIPMKGVIYWQLLRVKDTGAKKKIEQRALARCCQNGYCA